MPAILAKASGKIILFGEHAVVYGQPAIAIPVDKVYATARIFPNVTGNTGDIHIQAPDIQLEANLADLPVAHPFAAAIQQTLAALAVEQPPALTLLISATIPIAAGMGSSAAITIAIIRALADFLGQPLSPEKISSLAFEVEKIQHGTPSGIDNHVIAHQKPVFFAHGKPIEHLQIEGSTHWVIADTGKKTPTRMTVADVRSQYAAEPKIFDAIFKRIGLITTQARPALIEGDVDRLGGLLDENQHLLDQLTVSSQSLENLIKAAKTAGAAGAKLSGGGRGGNMIALSRSADTQPIESALLAAGAVRVITTTLSIGGSQ